MKLKLIALLIGTSLLSGCASTVYKTQLEIYCPPIVEYSKEFNSRLVNEIESLPPGDSNIVEALSDYAALRDTIRACKKERDK